MAISAVLSAGLLMVPSEGVSLDMVIIPLIALGVLVLLVSAGGWFSRPHTSTVG